LPSSVAPAELAYDLAVMSYADADGFRRAMTHDRSDQEMEKMRDAFISNAAKNGVSRNIAEKVMETNVLYYGDNLEILRH